VLKATSKSYLNSNIKRMMIPIVDLNDFVNGTPEQKSAFVQKLGNA
jgi:hypothetical protein